MIKKIARVFAVIFILLSMFSCEALSGDDSDKSYVIELATSEIKSRAFKFAELYAQSDTEYKWGGQSPLRAAIQIDCSGLVIMCYKYALVDTKYSLIEDDMSSAYMAEYASEPTSAPEQGDLIFMGEAETDKITHIAIFDKEEDGEIYFIDSTDNGEVNGVSQRHYEKGNEKFKSFGVMKVKY